MLNIRRQLAEAYRPVLEAQYPRVPLPVLAQELGLSASTIRIYASMLGIRRRIPREVVGGRMKCAKCDQEFPVLLFAKDSSRVCGHSPYCKECRKAYFKDYHQRKKLTASA